MLVLVSSGLADIGNWELVIEGPGSLPVPDMLVSQPHRVRKIQTRAHTRDPSHTG